MGHLFPILADRRGACSRGGHLLEVYFLLLTGAYHYGCLPAMNKQPAVYKGNKEITFLLALLSYLL